MVLLILVSCAPDTELHVLTGAPAPVADWEPGAEIEGWPTFDCSEGERGDLVEVTAGSAISYPWLWVGEQLVAFDLDMFGCFDTACDLDSYDIGGVYLRTLASVSGGPYVDNASTGSPLGWVQAMGSPVQAVDVFNHATFMVYADSPPFWWEASAGSQSYRDELLGYNWVGGDTCLAEVRPDRLSAVVRLAFPARKLASDYTATWLIRQPAILRYRIDLILPRPCDEDGWGIRYLTDGADSGEGEMTALDVYDSVWPWDSIVDPEVRDRLYASYKPECD